MFKLRHLKDFILENRLRYLAGIFLLIICDGLQLVMPKLLGQLTDSIADHSITMPFIYRYIFIIMALAIGVAVLRYGWRMMIMGTSRKMEYWMRNKYFAHLETLSAKFYSTNKTGDLMALATNDINAIKNTFGQCLMMITDNIFIISTTVYIMFVTIDVRLSLFSLIPLPIIALTVTLFGKKMRVRFHDMQESFAGLTDKSQENISGIRVIQSFVQEKAEQDKFAAASEDYVQKSLKVVALSGLMGPMVMLLATVSSIIALYVGGLMVINKTISLGKLIEFMSYLGMLVWPMMGIGFVNNMMQRGLASLGRINDVLDTQPTVNDSSITKQMDDFMPTVEFRNLTFSYDENTVPALKDVSFNLAKGKTLAIIGRTGSGKTTVSNLLFRFFDAPNGTIFVGGHDIRTIPLALLRDKIACVPQDNFLFSTNIRDNIAFSNENMDFEDIKKAADTANIYNDIMEFPLKFDTMLGERGITLSGGQKQRISIARALAKNPSILVLDDCLSAVDTKTEEKILLNLKEQMKDKTCIIVAHRISSIKHADEILVMDGGSVIERGTHEELLSLGGIYYGIYEKQLLEEKIDSAE